MDDVDDAIDADVPDVPVAELFDEPPPRQPRPANDRRRIVAGSVAVACVVSVGVAIVTIATHLGGSSRTEPPRRADAHVEVAAAVHDTAVSGSFDMQFQTTETAGSHYAPPLGATIVGHGSVHADPLVMVATATVGELGTITTYVNGTTVWEVGGGNYGTTAGDAGSPLPGFVNLVESTLGARPAGAAMMSLASPTGYLNIAGPAIVGATKIGPGEVDGVPVTEYEVTMDAAQLVDRPGMTAEEHTASLEGYTRLQQQGYVHTTVRLAVDDQGFVRRTQTAVRFADGGSVNSDVRFSDFGHVPAIQTPGG